MASSSTSPTPPSPKKLHVDPSPSTKPAQAREIPVSTFSAEEEELSHQPSSSTITPAQPETTAPNDASPKPSTDDPTGKKARAKAKFDKSASKYKGKADRSEWGPRQPKPAADGAGEAAEGESEKKEKLPKKKVAIMIGYSGSGYSGMQIQTDPTQASHKTIESELFSALVQAGAISKDNSDDHKKVDLQRAARTDAGVSASGNVISLKMILNPPGTNSPREVVERINGFLPLDIRVWGWVRTLGGFNARTSCETRVYEYLFPTYVLLPPKPLSLLHALMHPPTSTDADYATTHPFWASFYAAPDKEDFVEGVDVTPGESIAVKLERLGRVKEREGKRKRAWRAVDGVGEVERFKAIVAEYVGTHNFHNFTVGKPYQDKSVKRYMLSIDVAEPKVYGGLEWVSVKIHGQSFMLHQIRKMISLAVLMTRTNTPACLVPETYTSTNIHIPKAPALGLLLEQPQFAAYNVRLARSAEQNKTETNDPIDFEPYRTEIYDFKVKHIYERLREDEEKTNTYMSWTNGLDWSDSKDLGYLNSAGKIPESAVRKAKGGKKKGEAIKGVESDDDAEAGKRGGDD